MPKDLTAIKREKANMEVSTGLIQVDGDNMRTKSGSKAHHPAPTKHLTVEGSKSKKK